MMFDKDGILKDELVKLMIENQKKFQANFGVKTEHKLSIKYNVRAKIIYSKKL